jgi:hypothetical protein
MNIKVFQNTGMRSLGILVLVCAACALLGCNPNVNTEPTVDSVTVSPSTTSVAKGGTQTFTAEVIGTNSPAQTVTWKVEGGIAGTTIVNGLLTVAIGESATSLTVTATSTVNTTKFDTAVVTVSGTVTVSTVTVSPSTTSVAKGGTETFTAVVTGTLNPAQTVTWKVEGGIAETTIDVNGKLKVSSDETATELTVRATSTVDTTKSGTATVTVTESIAGEWEEITGAWPLTINQDGTWEVVGTIQDENNVIIQEITLTGTSTYDAITGTVTFTITKGKTDTGEFSTDPIGEMTFPSTFPGTLIRDFLIIENFGIFMREGVAKPNATPQSINVSPGAHGDIKVFNGGNTGIRPEDWDTATNDITQGTFGQFIRIGVLADTGFSVKVGSVKCHGVDLNAGGSSSGIDQIILWYDTVILDEDITITAEFVSSITFSGTITVNYTVPSPPPTDTTYHYVLRFYSDLACFNFVQDTTFNSSFGTSENWDVKLPDTSGQDFYCRVELERQVKESEASYRNYNIAAKILGPYKATASPLALGTVTFP